jgi:drug/metabolite transporter (DMT)-like permease
MWQLGSILLCSINVFNTLLSTRNSHTLPFLQLALTYTFLLLFHIKSYQPSEIPWRIYIIVAIVGSASDACLIYSYNTTSLSSAMLLSTTVVFWVTPLDILFLKRHISIAQGLALLLGFSGTVIVFIADGTGEMRWLGNVLALGSAFLYAIANVLQERLVQSAAVNLYLCRFSLVASPANIILAGAVEWKDIRDYDWQPVTFVFIFAYALLMAGYYSFMPFMLQFSTAIEMSLSLLSVNFFSLLISILAFGQKAEWLYLVGFMCVPIAIAIYFLCPPKEEPGQPAERVGAFEATVAEQSLDTGGATLGTF